jgi:GNAT superfamily N-acetyltransferase
MRGTRRSAARMAAPGLGLGYGYDRLMPEIRIRDRRPCDLEGCVEALLAVHVSDGYPMNWPGDPVGWLSPADGLRAWVAVADGIGVVGHVMVQGADGKSTQVASVARLFVGPQARGQGLGARLLGHARQWAEDRGIGLVLEVVADERSRAFALYERTGWRRTDTQEAPWTGPDGKTVLLHRYALPEDTRQG